MKTKIILLLFSVLIIVSCEPQRKRSFANQQQESFDNFLKSKKELEYSQSNEIQKKEFNKKFEIELANYLDSIGIFVNWKGQIKDIKTREYGQSTQIEFEILYKPEEYREVSFHCSHIVKTENLTTDFIYNKVKEISDYSTVYFDGFIKKDIEGKVVYDYGDMNISYPNYKFNIIDINVMPKSDTLSVSLKNAIVVDFQVIDLLNQKFQKSISEKEWERKTKDLNFDFVQSKLSNDEKQYSQRIRQCLVNDFMYE